MLKMIETEHFWEQEEVFQIDAAPHYFENCKNNVEHCFQTVANWRIDLRIMKKKLSDQFNIKVFFLKKQTF
jgi:hypothetical protein